MLTPIALTRSLESIHHVQGIYWRTITSYQESVYYTWVESGKCGLLPFQRTLVMWLWLEQQTHIPEAGPLDRACSFVFFFTSDSERKNKKREKLTNLLNNHYNDRSMFVKDLHCFMYFVSIAWHLGFWPCLIVYLEWFCLLCQILNLTTGSSRKKETLFIIDMTRWQKDCQPI